MRGLDLNTPRGPLGAGDDEADSNIMALNYHSLLGAVAILLQTQPE
jgi:hypothetical protein